MSSSDGKYDLEEEKVSIVEKLREDIAKLESEKVRMITIIQKNDLGDLLDGDHIVLPEESICINEIRRLKELSDIGQFGTEEAKIYDIIAKNYRILKGLISDDKSKKKKMTKEELGKLFNIVGNNETK